MHRTARITWGETREREKSGEEEEGKNRGVARGYRGGGETKERRLYEGEGKEGVEWRDGEPEDRRASMTEG